MDQSMRRCVPARPKNDELSKAASPKTVARTRDAGVQRFQCGVRRRYATTPNLMDLEPMEPVSLEDALRKHFGANSARPRISRRGL